MKQPTIVKSVRLDDIAQRYSQTNFFHKANGVTSPWLEIGSDNNNIYFRGQISGWSSNEWIRRSPPVTFTIADMATIIKHLGNN